LHSACDRRGMVRGRQHSARHPLPLLFPRQTAAAELPASVAMLCTTETCRTHKRLPVQANPADRGDTVTWTTCHTNVCEQPKRLPQVVLRGGQEPARNEHNCATQCKNARKKTPPLIDELPPTTLARGSGTRAGARSSAPSSPDQETRALAGSWKPVTSRARSRRFARPPAGKALPDA
jgi:hypothetical protein